MKILTTDAVAVAEDALAKLQHQYVLDPQNYHLGKQVGELNNRLLALKRAALPKPVYERMPPAPPALSNAEWTDRLPERCSRCGGRLDGYATRIGELGFRCAGQVDSRCRYEGTIER